MAKKDPKDDKRKGKGLPPRLEPYKWTPGASANPGGAPTGKRISTWMVEFGNMTQEQLDAVDQKTLTQNAHIALARVRQSRNEENPGSNAATDLIMNRTEGPLKMVSIHIPLSPAASPEELARLLGQDAAPGAPAGTPPTPGQEEPQR